MATPVNQAALVATVAPTDPFDKAKLFVADVFGSTGDTNIMDLQRKARSRQLALFGLLGLATLRGLYRAGVKTGKKKASKKRFEKKMKRANRRRYAF